MTGAPSAEKVNEFLAKMRQSAEENSADRGKVEGGRWAKVSGLQSDVGRRINGKYGQVEGGLSAEGRYPVMVEGQKKKMGIKPANLEIVPNDDLVQVVRIAARGENLGATFKVLLFPRGHPMFTRHGPEGNSPAAAMCGVPIVVERTPPQTRLVDRSDYDCQWATWFMIEPISGFAPMQWQSGIGAVLVYRPSGLDFGADDLDIFIEWFSTLLDNYPEDGFDYREWLNPDHFQRFKKRIIECRQEDGCGSSLKNLHI